MSADEKSAGKHIQKKNKNMEKQRRPYCNRGGVVVY